MGGAQGDLNAVSLLLQYGANIEKRNENQYRPLDMALFSKNQAAVQLLLDSGCEANYLDGQGWLPLHVCCCLGFEIGIIDTLLRKGLDINQGARGSEDTPLMLAVQENHVHVVKHLIARNVAVDAANYLGQCAIHIAIAYDHAESLQVLLQHRVDHALKTKSLEDILHYWVACTCMMNDHDLLKGEQAIQPDDVVQVRLHVPADVADHDGI